MDQPAETSRRQVIIQIDGLSRPALERAIKDGMAPALAGLLDAEEMSCVSVYSGLPSTTPAVQGELFYGVTCAVPAFTFLHDRREPRHMLDPRAADAVQQELEEHDPGLLSGGSSYCNIYTGGADYAAFCPVILARPRRTLSRGLKYQLRVTASSLGVGVRSARMLISEIARLLMQRTHLRSTAFRQRLRDTLQRVSLSVALRDSARIAVLHDLRHELPIVHVNFLGYDKQAHRYGPDAPAAMRALKGIDRAIASILAEVRRTDGDSTVLVYSDHGQEATTPIVRAAGAGLEDIVHDAASEVLCCGDGGSHWRRPAGSRLTDVLSEKIGEHFLGISAARDQDGAGPTLTTVESGPIAHVYLERRCDAAQRMDMAGRIAGRADGAAVLASDAQGNIVAFRGESDATPLEAFCRNALVEHPFADQIAGDLRRAVRHRDAGDLIILGTGFTDAPLTFADERGSHGGAGPAETHAFALVPARWALQRGDSEAPLRFKELRAALLAERSGGDDSRAAEP